MPLLGARCPQGVTTTAPESPMQREFHTRGVLMVKLRTARVLYFIGVVAAFVVAAGADRKFY